MDRPQQLESSAVRDVVNQQEGFAMLYELLMPGIPSRCFTAELHFEL